MNILKSIKRTLAAILIMLMVVMIVGCNETITGEGSEDNEGAEGAGGGEESAVQYAKSQTADETLNGARLTMSYDAQSNSFNGVVENISGNILQLVRVEVHLSNGIELGPTTPTDLGVDATMNVTLNATSQVFTTWSVHPESGSQSNGEGHGNEGGGS